jgi:hypothetical protein
MPQVTIQPASLTGTPLGTPIPLEVATFDESRKAKLKMYSRVQAFSDTALVIGSYNREFEMSVVVPQDFILVGGIPQAGGEDVETLLAGLQLQDQWLVDPEGVGRQVRITNVGTKHTGGQPFYYEVDVSMIAVNNVEISSN